MQIKERSEEMDIREKKVRTKNQEVNKKETQCEENEKFEEKNSDVKETIRSKRFLQFPHENEMRRRNIYAERNRKAHISLEFDS